MSILRLLGFLFVVAGLVLTYGAKWIVKKWDIAQGQVVPSEHEMTPEETERYQNEKALIKVKLIGMALIFPGILLSILNT
jgi:uncharacterized membrane protein